MTLLLFLACPPAEDADVPVLLGTIEARDSRAEVWDSATYFYASDDTLFLYMSIAEGVDCHDVANALDGGLYSESGDGPELFQPSGSCTLTVNVPSWSGELSLELAEGDVTASAALSVNCWMDGTWVVGEDGWIFDGLYWNGSPSAYTLDLEGDSDGGTFALSMDSYSGKDPYDFEGTEYPGSGQVAGEGDMKWCEEFEDTPFFD